MERSKIFTATELKVFEIRMKCKTKSDRTGIFYTRIKPKILELFEWFKKRKELQKALEPIKRKHKKL